MNNEIRNYFRLSKHEIEAQEIYNRNFSGQDLHGIDLSGWSLYDCSLENCNLQDANLQNCTIAYSSLLFANLISVDFRNATLKTDNLMCCDLGNASFFNTVLENDDLHFISGQPKMLQIVPHLNAATTEESNQYMQRIYQAFDAAKDPSQVLQSRKQWAHNWLEKVRSGVYDRTKSFQQLEPLLKELDSSSQLGKTSLEQQLHTAAQEAQQLSHSCMQPQPVHTQERSV